MANKIKRVTKLHKKIINQILEDGLSDYWYNDTGIVEDRAIRFGVTEEDIRACIKYVEERFCFW